MLAIEEEQLSSDMVRPTGWVTGRASYFPSIEKVYGRPTAEWKGGEHSSGQRFAP
jgi:hypothetical protein